MEQKEKTALFILLLTVKIIDGFAPSPILYPAANRSYVCPFLTQVLVKSISSEDRTDFRKLREDNPNRYVDKTKWIYDSVISPPTASSSMYISRPRGCGKTVNLHMLHDFYTMHENNTELFESLDIMHTNYAEFRKEYMNQLPVIHMTFADIKENATLHEAKIHIREMIDGQLSKFNYILQNDTFESNEKDWINDIRNRPDSYDEYCEVLTLLGTMLLHYHARVPLLLIDEIDRPLAVAVRNGYLRAMKRFMSYFFRATTRDVRVFKQAIFVGVTPLNHLLMIDTYESTVLSGGFDSSFGFTEKEVQTLLYNYPRRPGSIPGNESIEEFLSSLKKWYTRFKIGRTNIYNPQSIVGCLRGGWEIKKYAKKTGCFEQLTKLIVEESGALPMLKIAYLINQGTIKEKVSNAFSFGTVLQQESMMWNYFTQVGLVTTNPAKTKSDNGFKADVSIAGKDVMMMLNDDVIENALHHDKIPNFREFLRNLKDANVDQIRKDLQRFVNSTGRYINLEGDDVDTKREQIVRYMQLILHNWQNTSGVEVKIKHQGNPADFTISATVFEIYIKQIENKNIQDIFKEKGFDNMKEPMFNLTIQCEIDVKLPHTEQKEKEKENVEDKVKTIFTIDFLKENLGKSGIKLVFKGVTAAIGTLIGVGYEHWTHK